MRLNTSNRSNIGAMSNHFRTDFLAAFFLDVGSLNTIRPIGLNDRPDSPSFHSPIGYLALY